MPCLIETFLYPAITASVGMFLDKTQIDLVEIILSSCR